MDRMGGSRDDRRGRHGALVEERNAVLRYCAVIAPFSGVVVNFSARAHYESAEATVSRIDGRIGPGGQIIMVIADPRPQDLALPLIVGMTGAATIKHALSLTQ